VLDPFDDVVGHVEAGSLLVVSDDEPHLGQRRPSL
jgi:hypothetical protein